VRQFLAVPMPKEVVNLSGCAVTQPYDEVMPTSCLPNAYADRAGKCRAGFQSIEELPLDGPKRAFGRKSQHPSFPLALRTGASRPTS